MKISRAELYFWSLIGFNFCGVFVLAFDLWYVAQWIYFSWVLFETGVTLVTGFRVRARIGRGEAQFLTSTELASVLWLMIVVMAAILALAAWGSVGLAIVYFLSYALLIFQIQAAVDSQSK